MSAYKIQTVQMISCVRERNVLIHVNAHKMLTALQETTEEYAHAFLILLETHMAQPAHQ